MPLPDYFLVTQGNAIVWRTPGASTFEYDLTFNNLLNGAARMGQAVDLGELYWDEYLVILAVETGTAPTSYTACELYLACSHDNINWPGGVTGLDAPFTIGTSDVNLRRIGAAVSYCLSQAAANTLMIQAPVIWRPRGRYVAPVVVNRFGQALRNQSPPQNNLSRLYLVPRRSLINE